MERKVILAIHGNFAAGIQTSLALICGETESVEYLYAYMEQPYDLVETVKDILKDNQQNELIVITSLSGGSMNNEFSGHVGKQVVHLISGLNLVTLIEIYTQINTADPSVDLVKHTVENGQGNLCYCNELSSKEILEEEFQKEMRRLNR